MSHSGQGSLGLGEFSHKNVGALNSEQNSSCLETWDRLGEEAGTGRTRRRSSPSQLSWPCQKLGLQRTPAPGTRRGSPQGRPTAGRRGGLSLPGARRAAWQPCAPAAMCALCGSRFGKVPRPALSLAGCLQCGSLSPVLTLFPSPSGQPLARGTQRCHQREPALTPACTTPSGRSISAPSS